MSVHYLSRSNCRSSRKRHASILQTLSQDSKLVTNLSLVLFFKGKKKNETNLHTKSVSLFWNLPYAWHIKTLKPTPGLPMTSDKISTYWETVSVAVFVLGFCWVVMGVPWGERTTGTLTYCIDFPFYLYISQGDTNLLRECAYTFTGF